MKSAIEKTVDFWTDKAFSESQNWDNGDNTAGGMAGILGNLLNTKMRSKVGDQEKESFRANISQRLEEMTAENGCVYLDVDYNPCMALEDVCAKSGVNPNVFPCKTSTKTADRKAWGKCGYGKPMEEL